MDGRTREDGVRAFLAARGIDLPEGTPGDGPGRLTVNGLAARKQGYVAEALAHKGVQVFASTVELLRRLQTASIRTALVTSSRNSQAVLDAAGISNLFTVRVDGTDAVRLSLAGKPNPAMFLEAARRLQVEPADAVVVEDAAAGVEAGVAGGFGLVVGVDHTGSREQLLAAGAHVVVEDLDALDLSCLRPGGLDADGGTWCGGTAPTENEWLLTYDQFNPADEGTRETLCTLGNGYWATRGAVPGSISDDIHYPGTYLAGVYNRLTTDLSGHLMEAEHMVNTPDWTSLTIHGADGQKVHPGSAQMLSHR